MGQCNLQTKGATSTLSAGSRATNTRSFGTPSADLGRGQEPPHVRKTKVEETRAPHENTRQQEAVRENTDFDRPYSHNFKVS